jgi:hypothetical protein
MGSWGHIPLGDLAESAGWGAARGVLVVALVATLGAAPGWVSAGSLPEVSDSEILTSARSRYDKRAMMNKTVAIGLHNGARVIAEYPCSDICPDYTVRIIRYEVPLEACPSFDGVVVRHRVPRGIATTTEEYCVPRVLVEHGEAPEDGSRGYVSQP